MLQYTMGGGSDKSALAIVTVDSPKVILAIDPLAALLEFAVSPFKKTGEDQALPAEEDDKDDPVEGPSQPGSLSFRVEIVQSTIMVLADDTDARSQAIQLSVKEVLLSQQSILALKVDKLGMSFGRMDQPKERVKFLDELNIALSLDTRRRGSQQMTSFDVDIPDPIILRASYTDMMLITDIVNKASAVASKALATESGDKDGKDERQRPALRADASTDATSTMQVKAPSARRTSVNKRRGSVEKARMLVSKEQVSIFTAQLTCLAQSQHQRIPIGPHWRYAGDAYGASILGSVHGSRARLVRRCE
jgi:vacuolar protein sorting-associated protein 13A/C